MPTTLQKPRVASALDRMYAEAEQQLPLLRERQDEFAALSSASARERADALSAFYIPVTPEGGRLLYLLVRATCPRIVAEFGMSFGVSAIHMAAAVRDNGTGHVVTTELSDVKIERRNAVRTPFADRLTSSTASVVTAYKGLLRSEKGAGMCGDCEESLRNGKTPGASW